MGAVYLAEDKRLRRKVALKRLSMVGNPADLEMFVRRFELQALEMASFQHTNIVNVYDFGHDDEGIYLILKFMPGGALTDRLRHGRIPFSQAVKIASIQQSIDLIQNSGLSYEFRTTVVPEWLTVEDIIEIGKWLQGAQRYALQQFYPGHCLNSAFNHLSPYPTKVLKEMKAAVEPYFEMVLLKGV
jgi:hypothetical protein